MDTDFKDQWNLEMALQVLENETVDRETWSEAAKWLMLYGPPHIREILLQASGTATNEYFPGLKPTGFTEEGQPCYDVHEVAQALGISVEEAAQALLKMEAEQGVRHLFDQKEARKLQ